jgi:hypothetical protein
MQVEAGMDVNRIRILTVLLLLFMICFLPLSILADSNTIREKEVDRNGTLITYATGVVFDKNTGLEWFAGPDRGTNWEEVKSWVERLDVAGGGWRMPTRKELKTLYKKGAGTRNMTPLLKTTGWSVWSGETADQLSAWAFYFRYGKDRWCSRDYSYQEPRGFAVRSR